MIGEERDRPPELVLIYGDDDQPVGTGFVISRTFVLTCAHVVTDAFGVSKYRDAFPRGELRVAVPGTELVLPAEVVPGGWLPLRESSGDLAVLSLADPIVSAQSVARVGVAQPGDRVRLLTPEAVLSAVIRETPDPNVPDGWVTLAFDAAAPEPGSSGSPVVGADDAVIGLLTAARNTPQARDGWLLPLAMALEKMPIPGLRITGSGVVPASGLTLRERGELVEALLAVPLTSDPVASGLLKTELIIQAPEIAHGLRAYARPRPQMVELVNQCSRHPEGLRLLVDVIQALDPGSPEVEAFAALVDKVSAPSLLLAGERRALHRLVARAAPGGDLLEQVRDLEDRTTPRGRPPALLEFVLLLAGSVEGDVGADLASWNRTVAARLGVELRPSRAARPKPRPTPVLTFRLDADEHVDNVYELTASVRMPDGHTYRHFDHLRRVYPDELEQAVRNVVRRADDRTHFEGGVGLVEFVLPFQLLSLPVESFPMGDGANAAPLGWNYRVVVRAAELEDRSDLRRRWEQRWRRLKDTSPEEREPRWVEGAGRRVLLLDAVGVFPSPSGDPVASALVQGIPVVAWSRDAEPGAEAALSELARSVPLEQIPEAVRLWRRRAEGVTGGPPGYVSLIFADPETAAVTAEPGGDR